MSEQLINFAEAFSKTFYSGIALAVPKNWRDALSLLTREIEKARPQKCLLFFDELPWLAAQKSGFIEALDYFWNSSWSQMPNLKVILCGSAASWMLEHLIHAKGGLHNRITRIIQLQPLSLAETKAYLSSRKIRLNEKHLLDLYMVMGGIPYYLNYVEAGKSAEQNIQEICFTQNGVLLTEFNRLFHSLFDDAETHLRIIREIARKREGISRGDLLAKLGMLSGGTFKKRLAELEAAGFIRGSFPIATKERAAFSRIG